MILAVYPRQPSTTVGEAVGLIADRVDYMDQLDVAEPALQDADILVVELGDQPMRRLREAARVKEDLGIPLFLLVQAEHMALIDGAEWDDFQIGHGEPVELRLRLLRLARGSDDVELLQFKDLQVNTLTYQAVLAGQPMDLTFMEYELLRFLVQNPVRVWSREQLLSKVWGYEYYGGARTVDVHIRRLRSKLGEERSSWIATVRSVGYRFG